MHPNHSNHTCARTAAGLTFTVVSVVAGATAPALAAGPEYATFLGGTGAEQGLATAVAPDGTLIVAGYTTSPNFPFTAGAPIAPVFTQSFNSQPFVARIDPTQGGAAGLIFADFLGGTDGDGGGQINAVAVDPQGNIYAVGQHQTWTLPVVNGFASHPLDRNNGFLVKLSPDGQQILYSTYIGGSNNVDEMHALVVDAQGVATIGGRSSANDFPVKGAFANAPQNGLFDAVALQVDTNTVGPASLLWSTAYGGHANEVADRIAVGPAGLVYIAGTTSSYFGAGKLPLTPNAFQTVNAGSPDAFLAVFDPAVAGPGALVYGSYLGGTYPEEVGGLGVDPNGDVYLAGATQSVTFPVTPGVHDTTLDATFGAGNRTDVFVIHIDPFAPVGAETLIWSTLMGAEQNDYAWALQLDAENRPVIAGYTASPSFPTSACSAPKDANWTAFVARFDTAGALEVSRLFGGADADFGKDLALLPDGRFLVVGTTASQTLPTTATAVQAANAGPTTWNDTFATVLWDCTTCPPGQAIGPNGLCEPCPAGSASGDGTDCRACPPGSAPDAEGIVCIETCQSGQLAALSSPGLAPVFAPGTSQYAIPATASDSSWVQATLCDPSQTLYVNGSQAVSGQLMGTWLGNGSVTISVYDGWTQVGGYTLTVDPNLPPAALTQGLAGLQIAGLSPAFDPAVTEYTIPSNGASSANVTATLTGPANQLYVANGAATSGQAVNVWAPAGGSFNVSAYVGWTELGHYHVTVLP